jgi:hypothetical protein
MHWSLEYRFPQTYEHLYKRGNLARTAMQLLAAGHDNLLWVVVEDTHSLRKMTSSTEQYNEVLDATERWDSYILIAPLFLI